MCRFAVRAATASTAEGPRDLLRTDAARSGISAVQFWCNAHPETKENKKRNENNNHDARNSFICSQKTSPLTLTLTSHPTLILILPCTLHPHPHPHILVPINATLTPRLALCARATSRSISRRVLTRPSSPFAKHSSACPR